MERKARRSIPEQCIENKVQRLQKRFKVAELVKSDQQCPSAVKKFKKKGRRKSPIANETVSMGAPLNQVLKGALQMS